nr:integrase, catalytic region, zinc finger, CCHC-type, peptidase aspartic, catalytic [Tanacetum cinerariifolium]
KLHTEPTQTITTQLPHDFRKTNKRVSFFTRVIPLTSVSRPQHKSNQIEDRVMLNNSQGKKQEVEDHRKNVKFSKNKTFVTACNDSLNAKTLNVNFVCVTCGKCVLNDKHDKCVLHSHNGMNSRTKMLMDMPISTREPTHIVNHSVAKPLRRTVASESTNKKPRHTTRKIYEHVSKACSLWYPKFTPPGYKWKPKSQIGNVNPKVSMPLGNASRIANILEPMTPRHSTVSNTTLTKMLMDVPISTREPTHIVNHSVAKPLRRTVASESTNKKPRHTTRKLYEHKSTCYIRDLKGNDLLTGSRSTDLYSFTLQDTSSPNPIFLMAKATSSQAWLWHCRLSHLNFDSINFLSKNDIVIGLPKLKFVKDHLCSSWYSTQSRAYMVFNKRTRVIVETIHVNFDELPQMASDHVSSDPVPQCQRTTLEHDSLSPGPQSQENVPIAAGTVTTSNELDLLFSPIDGKNLDKMKEKGDACIFVGYSTQSRAYMVFNKRTRVIVETIHVNFDELPQMALDHVNSYPVLQCQRTALEHDNLSPDPQFVSKSSTVTTADAPNQCQQQHTPTLNTQTTPEPTCQVPTQAPTVMSTENIHQAETITENAQVKDDEFISIFSTPVQDRWETSSRHVDSSNMHTFYQRHPSEHRWMKDHPLEQVIGNPSQSVRTRRQL